MAFFAFGSALRACTASLLLLLGLAHAPAAQAVQPQVAAGDNHTAFLSVEGDIWTWGYNYAGQLGDGTTDESLLPKRIGSGYAAISAGNAYTLALKADGSLWAWGNNSSGQLGDGTTANSLVPKAIGLGYSAISAGWAHALALKTDGTLWAWGSNERGQLGDGTIIDGLVPKQVGTGFTAISASTWNSVAVATDGSLWVWGGDNGGLLGVGSGSRVPVQIGSGFAAVSSGVLHTIALKTDGSLWAWGVNAYGQLGDGTTIDRPVPTQVGSGFSAVSAGRVHSVALKGDGSLWAWGDNNSGQLGDGTWISSNVPKQVGSSYAAVSARDLHTVALRADDSVWTWGDGSSVPRQITLDYTESRLAVLSRYYTNILGRVPDEAGQIYWMGEFSRMVANGADPKEAFIAMAVAFFESPEFKASTLTDAQFVERLYLTFFNRTADSVGLDYWMGELQAGRPRDIVMYDFLFSGEFYVYMAANVGRNVMRPETGIAIDFYRGFLSRLPDDDGFAFWRDRFRAAQCAASPGNAVNAAVEDISSLFANSQEYANRERSNSQYVGDLYNAFFRRGGDLNGVKYWIDQIDLGMRSRENVRQAFVASPEFQNRLAVVIAAGCLQ